MDSVLHKLAGTTAVLIVFASLTAADPLDHWTLLSLPGAPALNEIAYGNGRYVAVGDRGAIYVSTNGFSWFPCQSGTTNKLWSVTYGNGIFVTADTATFPTILTSADGVHWTSTPSETYTTFREIKFAQSLFFAAQNNGIATSTDGTHWLQQKSTQLPNISCGFGNGMFVCGGMETFISVDATNWIPVPSEVVPGLAGVYFGSIVFGNGTLVGIHESPSQPALPFTSSDGTNWLHWPQPDIQFTWGAVSFGHDVFVMAGGGVGVAGGILTSTTGTNWTLRTPGSFSDLYIWNITYGGGRFVACARGGNVGQDVFIILSDPYSPPNLRVSRTAAEGSMHLDVVAEKDRICTIEKTVDLQSWTPLHRYTNFTGVLEFEDTNASNNLGLYRVISE